MTTPLFTVLIDTYNYGHFIQEAIDSVFAQDFPMEQVEILIVDDGSTDDTAERLKRYGSKIRYLYKPNAGQASAFNFGFQHAQGEIVALLDADDVWFPEKLRRVHESFERNSDAGMVYHRVHWSDSSNQAAPDPYFIAVSGCVPASRRTLLTYPMAGTSCLAFRRAALGKLLPVPETLRSQADAYLTALIIFLFPVVAVPDYLGKYRLHGRNLFQAGGGADSRERIEHRMAMRGALFAEIEKWLQKNGHDTASPDLRAYLAQWEMKQEQEGFALKAPGRWRYFRHLLRHARTYGEIMTRRHRVHSFVRAYAALVLGYRLLPRLDDAWRKCKRWLALSRTRP